MDNENNLHQTAEVESFWSLLGRKNDKFSIYIPRIQRDYAQGRTDEMTTQIREKFVDDIFDYIVNHQEDGKTLDINFIYGNIEEDHDNHRFVPIDGQQRLTTLFLLYWYFAVYSGEIDKQNEVKERLLRFQYETRNVTGKFCQHLTNDVRFDSSLFSSDDKTLSSLIKNYYWFFSDFDNDASIRAMLVMLDAIHEKAKEYLKQGKNLDNVFAALTSDKAPIRFLYLNIDDLGLTDSIYIKMNARGKALTHFENFKAQLRNYLSGDERFANEFLDCVNGKWSQFFWTPEYRRRIQDPQTGELILENSFDGQMMKFFRFCMLMEYITGLNEDAIRNGQRKIRVLLKVLEDETDNAFTSHLFRDGFQLVRYKEDGDSFEIDAGSSVLSPESFHRIYRLLNILDKRKQDTGDIVFTDTTEFQKNYLDEKDFFLRVIGTSEKKALNNSETVLLFAEYGFLLKYSDADYSFHKEIELTRWLRLISNLIEPTLNVQLDILFSMIRSVNQLLEEGFGLDCLVNMGTLLPSNNSKSAFSSFTEFQVSDESIKSLLIKRDPLWKNLIRDSERTFLSGETDCLLDFSGIKDLYNQQINAFMQNHSDASSLPLENSVLTDADSKSSYYFSFETYLRKFQLLFDAVGVKKELEKKSVFRRALLCYGGDDSFMLPVGKPRQSFLDNNHRDFGFKRLLRDPNEGKRLFLKELMDDINVEEDVTDQLQRIIDNHSDVQTVGRWKRYFIEMPEILDSLQENGESCLDPQGSWIFCVSQRFIRRNNDDDILLLTKKQTNSINRELYSYVLFLKARKNGLKVSYHPDYSDGTEKYLTYTNNQHEEIHVVYKKKVDNNAYAFIAKKLNDSEVISYPTLEAMLDYISRTIEA